MNIRRGHESVTHRDAKPIIARYFNQPTWSVFYEQKNADLVVLHNHHGFVGAIEVESTPRNVIRNIERNITNGCHAIATVALQERYARQIRNKISNGLTSVQKPLVRVYSYTTLLAIPGQLVTTLHLGEKSSASIIGEMEKHPTDKQLCLLRNKTANTWEASLGTQKISIPASKAIPLHPGMRIKAASYEMAVHQ